MIGAVWTGLTPGSAARWPVSDSYSGRVARELFELGRGQRAGGFAPRARGEVMQDRVRGDLNDAATARQPAQEQGVALFLGAGLDRADDLGPPRGEMNPSRVGPARQGF